MKDYRLYTDAEIVSGVKSVDNQAFKALLFNRLTSINKYVLSNSGTEVDANEVNQRVLIAFYEKVRDGKYMLTENASLSTYLHRIGMNHWLTELKKRKKNPKSLDSILVEPILNEEDEDVFTTNESHMELRKAMSKLDETCRILLIGKYYYKTSDTELSEEIGNLSVENVRKRRYKCLSKLKRIYTTKK